MIYVYYKPTEAFLSVQYGIGRDSQCNKIPRGKKLMVLQFLSM